MLLVFNFCVQNLFFDLCYIYKHVSCIKCVYFIVNALSFSAVIAITDRLCGLVVRVLGYRSGGPGSIPGTTRKKNVVGLERGPFSLVSTTEELLDRKVAPPV
jgi:hypothetical protein